MVNFWLYLKDIDYASTSLFQRAKKFTTLHSYLDVTWSCYFWSNLFNVDVQYSFLYIVNYSCSLRCIEKNLVNYSCCGNC